MQKEFHADAPFTPAWDYLVDECDDHHVPYVLRRLFNCGRETHVENRQNLHHVGTSYSRDRKNCTIVGYYQFAGTFYGEKIIGLKIKAVAWDQFGNKLWNRITGTNRGRWLSLAGRKRMAKR